MIGIVFVLKNREEKRLNFFLDKDLTPIDCLPDDIVVSKEWSAYEYSFFALFEATLKKVGNSKYIAGLLGYTVKMDLYNKYT